MTVSEIKKQRYRQMYEHYKTYLEKLLKAQIALIEGGVKSYTIDDRTLTRFDITALSKEIEEVERKLGEYEALLSGKSRRKVVGIIPMD